MESGESFAEMPDPSLDVVDADDADLLENLQVVAPADMHANGVGGSNALEHGESRGRWRPVEGQVLAKLGRDAVEVFLGLPIAVEVDVIG